MSEFAPGESKIALATFPVKPAGLTCTAQLWLALNGYKVATSGGIPFVSIGIDQSISFPVTMPSAEGTYPIYLDVFVGDQLIAAFQAIEDVVIKALLVAGWQFEKSMEVPAWLWRRGTWSFYREEYVTSSLGTFYFPSGSVYWENFAPPYTNQLKGIGYTYSDQGVDPRFYTVTTVVTFRPDLGCWQATYERHYLGLDNTGEYWKTQIPTDVPLAFMFWKGGIDLTELESVGAADITDVWQHARAPEWFNVRMIIYDFDSFVSIIRKGGWFNASGGLALY